ncbi:hypothetical protein KSS87_013926 [Heliosperma pusillum]|nr:hypothetical protein KSS87_013926 [Heliosperma pusillum]
MTRASSRSPADDGPRALHLDSKEHQSYLTRSSLQSPAGNRTSSLNGNSKAL